MTLISSLELLNEPAIRRNIGDRGVRNSADACRYIVAGRWPVTSNLASDLYLVALKETGVPIGICGLLKRESMQDIENRFCLARRESFAQGVCTYSQKRLRPEGRSYRRRFLGKILEVAATRILVGWRAPRLIPRHDSCFPICKKYNFAAKITRNLGTSSFSLFPHKIQRSKYLAEWSLECSVT